jgi:hypothetical protein
MRRIVVLFSILLCFQVTSVVAQIAAYVQQTKGDTLVVKDEYDYGAAGALALLLQADTNNVPAGRVYQLHSYGYYSVIGRPTSSAKRSVTIAGYSNALIKNNPKSADLPIITGAVYSTGSSKGGLTSGLDLLVKNCSLNSGNSTASTGDWTFFGINPVGGRLTVDNCLLEHNIWVEIQPNQMQRIFWKNCYFVNLSGYQCRRNGGVVDFNSSGTIMDTLWVENCTHVMTQGSLYKYRDGYKTNKSVYNHNDFINSVGYPIMNRGCATNISVTNNIFVNCGLQGFAPILKHSDQGEVDPDNLPMGLINVTPDSAAFKAAGGGKFYFDKNLAYWDPKLTAVMPSALNSGTGVNGVKNWVSQMITMNSRTQAAFAAHSSTKYPYLVAGTWVTSKLPTFAKTATLFTTQIDNIITYIKVCSDTTSTAALSYWREINPSTTSFSYSDVPIPIDLSYTDADLKTAAIGGFPVGDLNWFPTQYASWKAQRTAEYAAMQRVLDTGTGIEEVAGIPTAYKLEQNYPNPFNPSTVINFTIPKSGNVTLKVYNALGQEVATLVNEYKDASNYKVSFNASKLASGIYIYTINAGDFTQSKKMMLLK